MKNNHFRSFLFVLFCGSAGLFGQSPMSISYQAIARGSSGAVLMNQALTVRFSILDSVPDGAVLYSETHNNTTNSFGLFNLQLGKGTPETGLFSDINWNSNTGKYLKTEIDPAGGISFVDFGTQELLSVPYALHANSASTSTNAQSVALEGLRGDDANVGQILVWNGNNWIPNWLDTTIATDQTLTGSGTSSEPIGISQQGAIAGEVLVWNGSNWRPGKIDVFDGDSSAENEIQYLKRIGNRLYLSKGGSVTITDDDSSVTNEIQTLAVLRNGNQIKLEISSGNTIGFSTVDGDSSITNEIQNISRVNGRIFLSNGGFVTLPDSSSSNEIQTLSIRKDTLFLTSGGMVILPAEVDGSVSNELQTLSRSNDTLLLSSGGFVKLPAETDGSTTNELQTISRNNDTIFLSSGGYVKLPAEVDGSISNEIQTLRLSNDTLYLSGSGAVRLPSAATDNQKLSISGGYITIEGGNTILVPDSSAQNEIQTITRNGGRVLLSSGGQIFLPDSSSTNEIQSMSLSGDTLFLSNGGYVIIPIKSQTWGTKGNSGLDTSNYIGMRDAKDLNFRISGRHWGRLYASNDNISFGDSAMGKAVGAQKSIALGTKSLYSVSYGIENVAIGYEALRKSVNGSGNIAIGTRPLYSNNSGNQNIAMGYNAMYDNTTGTGNFAAGYGALYSNKNGYRNVAIGQQAMWLNVKGGENFAVGFEALYNSREPLYSIALGYQAMYQSRKAYHNVALGYKTLYNDTGWGYNIGIGEAAGFYILTGEGNTSVGAKTYNTLQATYNNTTALGYQASATNSNRIILGNTSVTGIYAQVTSISSISDGRVKENVTETVPGLDFITRLRPVSYNLNIRKQNQLIYDSAQNSAEWKEKYDIEKIRFHGLIAQEVEKVIEENGFEFSGLEKPTGNDPLYHIRYGDLVIPLVRAVQEQQTLIERQQQEIKKLQQQMGEIDAIRKDLQELKELLKQN